MLRRCACATAGPSRRAASVFAPAKAKPARPSALDDDPAYAGLRGIINADKPMPRKDIDDLQAMVVQAERGARRATGPDLGPAFALNDTGLSAFAERQQALVPAAATRTFAPVPPLEDPLLVQFVGLTTKHGLKQRARRLATDVLDLIRRLTNRDPMPIFRMAVERAMPLVGLRQVKVTAMKKASVPTALRERQRIRLGINAILANADRSKPGRQRAERVAAEMLQICMATSPKDNAVLERKHELHRTAVAARSNVPGARGGQARRT